MVGDEVDLTCDIQNGEICFCCSIPAKLLSALRWYSLGHKCTASSDELTLRLVRYLCGHRRPNHGPDLRSLADIPRTNALPSFDLTVNVNSARVPHRYSNT